MAGFKLHSSYEPAGDQPQAIEELVTGIEKDLKHQVLLGITGSGKTFTMANVIQAVQKPTLILSHNKTLAAQFYLIIKPWRLSYMANSRVYSLKMQWSFLFPIMTIISPKRICRLQILLLKKICP